jgi:hypothetical protein
MQILKQSTAVDVLIGPFVDLTNGATAETGETPVVKLSKNAAALGTKAETTTPAHRADGYYLCKLNGTDTEEVGSLVLTVAASANALPVRHEFQVVEEAVYDAIYASGGTVESAADIAAAVHSGTILTGTVGSGTNNTTTISISGGAGAISPALTVTDQVKGRVILFKTNTTTAALRGQGAPIDGSSTTAITIAAGNALTTGAAEGDTFVIV